MVMEYVRGGELFARVANDGGSLVTEGDSIRIAKDLLDAVQYLHSNNIVHRDIKLENILCIHEDQTKQIRIKLADFGLSSRLTGREKSLNSLVGVSRKPTEQFHILTRFSLGKNKALTHRKLGTSFYL